MAEWKLNGLIDEKDLSDLQAVVDQITPVLNTIEAILELIAVALDVLAFLLIEPANLLSEAVGALVNALEQTVLDFLQNNAALAIHLNMRWNPDWKPQRLPGDENRGIVDWVNDAALPWNGSGMNGWLLEVATSAYDPTDPWRPLTDGDTDVRFGMMVVKGVPADGDFQELEALFEAFTDFGVLKKEWLKTKELLENSGNDFLGAMRMLGPAAVYEKTQEVVASVGEQIGEAYGTVIAEGSVFNDPGSTTVTNAGLPGEDNFARVQVGDTIRITQPSLGIRLHEIVAVVDDDTLTVDPAVPADNSAFKRPFTIYRGGIVALQREFADDFAQLGDYAPGPGNYPKWISAPLAGIVPGIAPFFDNLKKVADQLRVGINRSSILAGLALAAREKAQLLRKIVEELQEVLELVEALVAFLSDSYILVYTQENGEGGGMAGFVNAAIAADNKPDFGTNGVVIGMVVVGVTDDPSNHLEDFWKFLGLEVDSFKERASARDDALEETWNDLFP